MVTITARTSATSTASTAAGVVSPGVPGVGRPRLRVIDGGQRDGRVRAAYPDGLGVGVRQPAGVRTSAARRGMVRGGTTRGVGRGSRARGLSAVGEATAGIAAPGRLRLTRRGRLVVRGGAVLLAMVVALLAVLLLSRPAVAGADAEPVPLQYHVVLPGETLWGIAGEVAPKADRREVIAEITELNALPSAAVAAGQRIALPPAG